MPSYNNARADGRAQPPTNAAAALFYPRRYGWRVFPLHSIAHGACTCGKPKCSSPGKHPRTRRGVKDATTDATTITGWWARWPDANIGVATGSGLVVIDIDPAHGGDKSFSAAVARLGDLGPTRMCRTGSGGRHLYYSTGTRIPCSQGRLGPGIDVRGEDGYVVAPPSLHISGRRYVWERSDVH
jgi:hypothetical protein